MENKELKQIMERLDVIEEMLDNICVALMCQNNLCSLYAMERAEKAQTAKEKSTYRIGAEAFDQTNGLLETRRYKKAKELTKELDEKSLKILKSILDI